MKTFMKTKFGYLFVALAWLELLTANSQISTVFAQIFNTNWITYQGQLLNNGSPANGSYAMVFNLYTNDAGGTSLGTGTNNNVAVANGLFTTFINGNLLIGDFTNPPMPWPSPSWLELA